MSSSKFFRLYRGIDHSLPSKTISDHDYEKERKEILSNFNEFQPFLKTLPPVERPKHHGRIIRKLTSSFNNERRKDYERKQKETKDRRHIQETMRKSIEIKEVIENLHKLSETKEKIPLRLERRMDFLEAVNDVAPLKMPMAKSPATNHLMKKSISFPSTPGAIASSATSPSRSAKKSGEKNVDSHIGTIVEGELLDDNERGKQKSKQQLGHRPFSATPKKTLPNNNSTTDSISVRTAYLPRIDTKTYALAKPTVHFHSKSILNRDRSLLKWTLEERQKLNSLYYEMSTPSQNAHLEIWKAYLIEFAKRFHIFYPNRSMEDITEKIRTMLAKKQMKEKGEEEFWKIIEQSKSDAKS
jgi:hypothetical protein